MFKYILINIMAQIITFGQSQSTPQELQTFLVNFCREEQFKQYVRDTIDNRLFLIVYVKIIN